MDRVDDGDYSSAGTHARDGRRDRSTRRDVGRPHGSGDGQEADLVV
jgi:hypothetical protein